MGKVFYTFAVEIEGEKLKAMLKSYNIPVTEENVDDLVERIRDNFDEDLDLTMENCASYQADDLGIEPPGD